ncbi:GlxA family transcriptional regulator [Pseudonocardia zijingensis]|jgi:transcriptional regulator GlxA family with amidase domain|uniref:GlxA family transcriptional regulator n=1 Tax=Pseudonocardia zijingensis TaxID=153376 RepID=UPI0031E2C8DD
MNAWYEREIVVAILAVPRAYAMDVSIPAHVFDRHPGYHLLVCGERDPLSEVDRAAVVVVPGYEDPHLPVPQPYLEALRRAAERGARIVAVCTGVFALAACGVAGVTRVTTHWRHADELRAAWPGVEVLENRLLVEDGNVLTSAGASAGVDACLHVVRSDFGAAAADEVAKEVVSPARAATDPQYTTVPAPARDDLAATREWLLENLASPITVQQMADRSLLSRRTFIRRFVHETGVPPLRWVTQQRLLSARRLLEVSDWSVERIAAATGFGTAANFRSVFRREVGATPTAYRKRHGASRPQEVGSLKAPTRGERIQSTPTARASATSAVTSPATPLPVAPSTR